MKLISSFLCMLCISFPAFANDIEQAKPWLERLSTSLKTLNYSTSFVVVKNNQAEPYHWLHGVDDKQQELEILAQLNGPRRDVLRRGNTVSYIEPEQDAYSVSSAYLSGPIPAIFSHDIEALESSYRFISVGRSRVLGRVAQVIRIVPKDSHRFDHWLWLDQQSGLLLKMAIITRQGQLLEQVQFTHLDVTNDIAESLKQLQSAELPSVSDVGIQNQQDELFWHVSWLPQGIEIIKSSRRRVNNDKTVEFILLSDGLVEISVYINPSNIQQRPIEYASDGATAVFSQIVDGLEVSVVGKIPLETAKMIADSVGPVATNSQ
ncbi:MucB/RseB C-terminal domain-containing protein [Colwellia sp. D2M02]|uniref:MucB/RseB C-terminal domain-containing protein n=1 Tax=Colwellia sp. D2M02 TaxID=2841562 RepID=UPI001C0A0B2E|nr:MucB/RseB C-terminal domain-containing protein [Colwellia sp. D2M02]MBU2894439.1 MucB/RseB C-terminal domain-containing protein [Colwellia sp. D2M02]